MLSSTLTSTLFPYTTLFRSVVQTSGKYIYSFLPHLNKREKRYNMLRHAGTTYSMLETYELMPDDKLLAKAERAFDYLFDRIKPHRLVEHTSELQTRVHLVCLLL